MKGKRFTALRAVFLILLLCVSGCAGLKELRYGEAAGGESEIVRGILSEGGYYNSPASVADERTPSSLYVSENGRIVFQKGGKRSFLDEYVDGKGSGRNPRLYKEGNHFYAIWWAKTKPEGYKHLYFRPSYNGGESFEATRIINTGNGALNFSFASDGSGNMAFAYTDERRAPYEVYMNFSHDYGRTWLERDVKIDSIQHEGVNKDEATSQRGNLALEPNVAVDGQSIVVTWKEHRLKDGSREEYYLKAKVSGDGGRTWAEEVALRGPGGQIFTSDSLLFIDGVFYIIGHENHTGITGFMSRDRGGTWEEMGGLKGSDTTVNSQIKFTGRGGSLYIAYTSEEVGRKAQVYFAAFSINDGAWAGPVKMDSKGLGLAKSVNPDITLLGNGTIVIAWEDYRNIRPNIYLNLSSDKGKSWLDMPLAVEEAGRYNSVAPDLYAINEGLFLFFQRYRDDARKDMDYFYREYDIKDGEWFKKLKQYPALPDEAKEKALKERVSTFWKLRVERRYADIYDYYDPYYRMTTDKEKFISYQGNIIYEKVQLVDTEIKGNFATVKLAMTFEGKETMIMGKKFSMPKTDSTISEDWVWLYDNWYKVYKKPVGQQSLLNY